MADLEELAEDVRARGLARVFAARGRELVSTPDGRRLIAGENLRELIRADPELRRYADRPAPPEPEPFTFTRRTLVALAAAGLVESEVALARAAPLQRHPDLREADGSPVWFVDAARFQNWGRTVRNTPALTFVPRTKHGVREIVKWARANHKRVRAAGYRHSWSDVFSGDGQVLISMLPPDLVDTLPAAEPAIDPENGLQGIKLVGRIREDGVTKALCRIGAATTNEQFRRWCLDENGGAWAWTVPLNVVMVEITWGGSNAPICHGAGLRHEGDEIPRAMRIANVARDAAVQHLLGGAEGAAAVIRKRAGGAFDPQIADCLADNAAEILSRDPQASAWEETLAAEPHPRLTLEGQAIDRALSAMGAFADLVSPSFVGHSNRVADLVAQAADRCRLDAVERRAVRRAALVHELGRVAVPPRVWNRPGPLSADEWEQVRLHPYQTERILSRSPFLAALAPLAGAHHERLDGSGYHRGATAAALSPPARLLAVADAYHAMTQPRPHREPLAPERAAEILSKEASAERLDADAVAAVVEATGQPVPRIERPGGLTAREAEVIGLVARGLQTKQIARALGISVKTADRHIQNAYGKIGVSTRAAAAVFAMDHGLAAWGELPIARAAGPS